MRGETGGSAAEAGVAGDDDGEQCPQLELLLQRPGAVIVIWWISSTVPHGGQLTATRALPRRVGHSAAGSIRSSCRRRDVTA
jgi:hypothetical protein